MAKKWRGVSRTISPRWKRASGTIKGEGQTYSHARAEISRVQARNRKLMSAPPDSLKGVFDHAFAGIGQVRETFAPQLTPREVGTITNVSTGIARVSGLPGVGFEELVEFPGGVFGIAFNVDEDEIGVVLLGEYQDHTHEV